jgi:hypothetical protein
MAILKTASNFVIAGSGAIPIFSTLYLDKVLGKTLPTAKARTVERIGKNYIQNIGFNFISSGKMSATSNKNNVHYDKRQISWQSSAPAYAVLRKLRFWSILVDFTLLCANKHQINL